ncbi:MAG: hypothetical protein V1899_06490 [Planctomycetota bacterium]
MLGDYNTLLVPVELRFQPVEGRKLIEAVAAAHNLKVAWTQNGRYAVLYTGAADDEIERVRKDLALADATVRRATGDNRFASSYLGCCFGVG